MNENGHEWLILMEYSREGVQEAFFAEVFKMCFVFQIPDKAI